ncbi:hypothetical protein [Vagococcus hydrophili]|uniref:UvrABC system protein A n=1 Tax=Vagococcus hydrophili TaxID=2714947 RepID=A0A6G8AWW6_9ENTE|nr:hypothetical protein [Vagococcus hydrophili]QIL49591.1 hypothetical protein G7082_14325 [Vagococcus hydrophili]
MSDQDLTKLLLVIEELLEKGNTVLVIEHNMLLVRQCDWIIDFGPGSGKHGGQILFEGLLDDITKSEESITKNYLS